jgi:PKD repeat protein
MQTTSTVRPFWVEFTDISIGNNISRRWFFGDGDSSTVTNPNHLYTRSGNFSVSLIVTDGTYSDTLIKPNYVTVDFFTESNISFGTGNPSGIACGDYNSDGNTDVFICNMFEPNLFFRNVSNGIFTSITTGEMVNAIDFNLHCSWGDVNNDNLLDLCITVNDPASSNYLFLNDDTDFVRIAGGDFANDIGYFTSCSWIDYNQDGNLDIFTTNYYEKNCLYRNNGNENFTKVIEGELVNDIDYFEFGSWADYNNDGYSDIFITNSNGNNYLYMNNGDETFTRILSGDIVTDGVFSTRSCWGDFNNDGFMDLFVANYDEVNLLFKNNGNGTFERITVGEIANDRYNSYYGCWGDFDNDGFLDLMVRNLSTPNSLYLNLGNETFNKIYGSVVSNNPENSGMHSAWIDHDNNGFLDLINLSDPYLNNVLYSNLGNNNNWLEIKCRGVYSNSIGIGAKILLKTPINGQENLQYREINSDNYLTAHFGLGDATTVDSIIIKWPSGIVWDTTNVDVNQVLTIREKVPNHPPLIYVLPSLNMQEDTSLELPRQYWYPYVNDPDDPDSNLSFSVMPGSHIRVIQTDTLCTLFPDTNWFGIDSLVFRASDGSSLASKELFCQVQSINDPPEVENLPDTLNFPGDSSISIPLWEYVYDVETPDSLLKYYFNTRNDSLSYSFSDENGLLLISSVHNYSGITHIFITVEDDSSARISDSVTIVVFPPSVITSKEDQIPTRYILYQNFPNPFNSLTSIRFGLPERSKVKIEIYNILGEKVYTLIDEYKPAGYFTLSLNAMNFSSGLYFILMQANKYREFRKILLVK